MEECESHRELQLRIGLDDDVGGLPARRPGRTVLGEQALEALDLEVADARSADEWSGPLSGSTR